MLRRAQPTKPPALAHDARSITTALTRPRRFFGSRPGPGLCPIKLMMKVVKDAKIEMTQAEKDRALRLATLTSLDETNMDYGTMLTLVQNQIDVNMLYVLFERANTDVKYERVEFFLDVDEMYELLNKLGLGYDAKEKRWKDNAAGATKASDMQQLEFELDSLDKDSDGP